MDNDCVIVGASFAGLGLRDRAGSRRKRVTVLEKKADAGEKLTQRNHRQERSTRSPFLIACQGNSYGAWPSQAVRANLQHVDLAARAITF